MTLTTDTFNPAACRIERTLKTNAAYLVCQGTEKAVVKGESGVGTKHREGDGSWANYGRNKREDFTNEGATPQMKKSIHIMADVIAYVTGEEGFCAMPLKFEKARAWVNKIGEDAEMKEYLLNTNVWYLLPVYKNLADFEILLKERRPDFSPSVKAIQCRQLLMQNPNMFEGLGRILVCDLFFGVVDRFEAKPSQWNQSAWTNIGNIFLTWFPLRFLGLDFYDTQTNVWGMMLGMPWNTCKRHLDQHVLDAFNILKKGNVKQRDQLARIATQKLGAKTILPVNDKIRKAMRKGIRSGRDRLRAYWKNKINQDKWPRGLPDRFQDLGW